MEIEIEIEREIWNKSQRQFHLPICLTTAFIFPDTHAHTHACYAVLLYMYIQIYRYTDMQMYPEKVDVHSTYMHSHADTPSN